MAKSKFSADTHHEWKRLYAEGQSLQQIADSYGCNTSSVYYALRKLDTPMRPMSARRPFAYDGGNLDHARFWGQVEKRGPTECWEWQGHRDRDGYGQVKVSSGAWRTHRYSLWLAQGRLRRSAVVAHRCDNPPCVNPAHLFATSPAGNTADMIRKGRGNHGERHHKTPLTEADVLWIREAYRTGEKNQMQLAAHFGISQAAVSAIVRRKSWTHI